MRCVIVTILFLGLLLTVLPVSAHSGEMQRGNVDIKIVSDSGDQFHTISHKDLRRGDIRIIKSYLAAQHGVNYGIVIRNNMPERLGVVIAVDGRNIITGKKSYLRNNESMYIVDAYRRASYDGWRTDKNTVHRFYFTDMDDSYATRTFNDSSAMGVIAVAVFREKERPRILYERGGKDRSSGPRPAAEPERRKRESQEGDTAGTGFGEGTHSPVITVEFQPEKSPFLKHLVKYEWREALCRKGILRCEPKYGNRLWIEDGYAPYPPGYDSRLEIH